MITTLDEAALLAAVIASPEDDLPRLAYADWLEENARTVRVPCPRCSPHAGEPCPECDDGFVMRESVAYGIERAACPTCPTCRGSGKFPPGYHPERDPASGRHEGGWTHCKTCNGGDNPREAGAGFVWQSDGRAERAEFIRVQIELAAIERPVMRRVTGEDDGGPAPDPLVVRHAELSDHQRRLLRCATGWLEWLAPHGATMLRLAQPYHEVFTFRRGFVDEIRTTLALWLAHGPVVVGAHPVTRLTVTGKRPASVRKRSGGHRRFAWFALRPGDLEGPAQLPAWLIPKRKRRWNCDGTEAEAVEALGKRLLWWARLSEIARQVLLTS